MNAPDFDVQSAHKYFAAHCFNAAWELIRKADRTPADDEQMISLSHASAWHWAQQPDCTDQSLSIGYWQLSRVHALIADAENARKYGRLCLEKSTEPFYLGYAHEALARAESVAGNDAGMKQHLAEAWRHAEAVADAEHKQWLVRDLETLG
jgi:predicted phage gp36 major capsid-like protein